MKPPHFLNVDLDIESKLPLRPLARELGDRVCVMFSGRVMSTAIAFTLRRVAQRRARMRPSMPYVRSLKGCQQPASGLGTRRKRGSSISAMRRGYRLNAPIASGFARTPFDAWGICPRAKRGCNPLPAGEPNQAHPANPAMSILLHFERQCGGVADARR